MLGLRDAPRRPRRLAIGVFDGVHLGHREVMRGADCVLTFDPHPSAVTAPGEEPLLLTSPERRARIVAGLGIAEVVVIPFDAAFAARSAASFVDDVLVGALGATHVSVGENFHFGHRGGGDPATLCADPRFATRVVPLLDVGGTAVSSSVVRSLVAAGEVAQAARLLGGPMTVDVLEVDGGLATSASQALPGPGRYVCRAELADGTDRTLEVHAVRDGDAGRLRLRLAPGGGRARARCVALSFVERLGVTAAVAS